jgi:hypothetical protein
MHTSLLKFDQFAVEVDGAPRTVEDIFPDWHKHQRFGIVIQEPLGAVGASLLIQAAIAAFFHNLPRSWGHMSDVELPGPAMIGTYPEVYAFHVGRRHGVLGVVDFWPGYKEVFVEADSVRVLHEINGRGITILAVPEGDETRHHFIWPEYRTFLWRTESVFSYSASGRVPDPDVSIRSLHSEPVANTNGMLAPLKRVAKSRAFNADRTQLVKDGYVYEGNELDDLVRFVADVDARQYEVPAEVQAAAVAAREAIVTDGHATETYRRRDADYALRRLVP